MERPPAGILTIDAVQYKIEKVGLQMTLDWQDGFTPGQIKYSYEHRDLKVLDWWLVVMTLEPLEDLLDMDEHRLLWYSLEHKASFTGKAILIVQDIQSARLTREGFRRTPTLYVAKINGLGPLTVIWDAEAGK